MEIGKIDLILPHLVHRFASHLAQCNTTRSLTRSGYEDQSPVISHSDLSRLELSLLVNYGIT